MTDADLLQLRFLLRKFLELMVEIVIRRLEILLYSRSLSEGIIVVPQLPLCTHALEVINEKCRRNRLRSAARKPHASEAMPGQPLDTILNAMPHLSWE